jgi:Copper type II ascorbate-dependent monooxygenase, N-terminal domain/Secretion system C-terminal sorting domain
MKMKLLIAFLCSFGVNVLTGQTWVTDVAPILYKHCVSCHRAGGVGDFPLETYTDARLRANSILSSITSLYMPPYRANPAYRHFKEENVLTATQIKTISDWVDGGRPSGDLTKAPPLPNFQNGSQLSGVDMVLEVPKFTIFRNEDLYRAFVIPTGISVDKFFNEVEFIPGNNAIIHHIVLYTDDTNEPVLLDQADPGPGWSTNGMVGGITQNSQLIGEWTPGGTPIKLPSTFGYRIPANGYFIVEVHFAPNHLNQVDEGTIINLKLNKNNPRELYYAVLNAADSTGGLLNPPFLIPANTVRTLRSEASVSDFVPVPISVFTLTPHAHVFGKSFKSYAYRAGSNDTIPLIDIPQWDFYWQGTYTMQKPLKLLTSHICHTDITYDNTVDNPQQPFFPPVDVTWGEKTTNEMLFLFATVAIYRPGDENIVLDSSLLVSSAPDIVVQDDDFSLVNPMSDVLDIRSKVPITNICDLILYDINGKVQRQWREDSFTHSRTSVAELAMGTYFLEIRQGQKTSSYKLIKG